VLAVLGWRDHFRGDQAGPVRTPTSARAPRSAATHDVFHVTSAPWHLPGALSRAVALPVDGRLVIFGGLGPANATTGAVQELDPTTGAVVDKGALSEPVHDAAGASLGALSLVLGGGARSVTTATQGLTPTSSGLQADKLGSLPAPRADAVAVAVDGQVLVAGGYDGKIGSSDVLASRDGVTFTSVATLPQPVRYPAAVSLGHRVYLIGGQSTATGTGTGTGTDVDLIQSIDLANHRATVVGHLPAAISHAGVAVLGGRVYLFGGRSGGHALDTVTQIDLPSGAVHPAGRLPVVASDMAVVTLGDAAYLLGGEDERGVPIDLVSIARISSTPTAPRSTAARPPFKGSLLIADRGNNRLLVVGSDKRVSWTFPSASAPAPADGFYFPDDAFFVKHGTGIITNEEEQNTIIEITYPAGKVVGSYGHPNKAGRAPGFLNQPDDAYLLADGRVTVADAKNCRILFLNPDFTFQSEIGSRGRCRHDIPRDVGYPNGDTPLANGNILVSEIKGSIVDEITPTGTVVWERHLPLSYPSDPQQIGPDLYLIADYAKPGGLYEFTREGRITWSYSFPAGEQMLDHPSLAEMLPGGLICVNDDYRHRVVIIDPATKQIVWQYGSTDLAGTGPGQLNTPDGFDLLAPDNTSPTHPFTG
jgi:hypothetical protein